MGTVKIGVSRMLVSAGADFCRGSLAEPLGLRFFLDGRIPWIAGVGRMVLVKMVHWTRTVVVDDGNKFA